MEIAICHRFNHNLEITKYRVVASKILFSSNSWCDNQSILTSVFMFYVSNTVDCVSVSVCQLSLFIFCITLFCHSFANKRHVVINLLTALLAHKVSFIVGHVMLSLLSTE